MFGVIDEEDDKRLIDYLDGAVSFTVFHTTSLFCVLDRVLIDGC